MTNTQHTPGPWAIAPHMYGVGNLKVHGVEATHNGVTQPIANCGWDDKGQSQTNARLIAAAPELLAAANKAKRLLNQLPRTKQMEDILCELGGLTVAAELRAAIAKAEGR